MSAFPTMSLKQGFVIESDRRSDKRYVDCEIIALPGEYDPKSLAFAYQLNSSYAWIFDYHINLIRENGVIDQASRKFKGPEQSCPDFRYAAVFLSTFVIIPTGCI